MKAPQPTAAIAALPESRPFIAPEELAKLGGHTDLLRLGANESAFGPPPAALAAMQAAVARTSWYGDPESMDLREALAARHGCELEQLAVGAGIDDLMGLVVRAYLGLGDVSVATLGTYPTYAYHGLGYGARLETVPYANDGTVQLEALARRAHETGARAAYLANPDNPSGTFVDARAVAAFRAALPGGCLLVLDEAYADFVPAAELPGMDVDPRVVRLRTFSKAYGLAGARVGYALAAREIIAIFGKIRLQFGVNRTGQIGALAALSDERFIREVVAEVARGRDEYHALAASLGLRTLPSRTNFVCIDIGSRERAEAMVAELLRRAVFVRKPGAPPLDGFIRVTVGTQEERERFGAAFTAALHALPVPRASPGNRNEGAVAVS